MGFYIMNTKELKENRASVISQMQEIAQAAQNENRSFTADEQEKFDKLDAANLDFQAKIETQERVEKVGRLVLPEVKESVGYRANKLSVYEQDDAMRAFFLRAAGQDHLVRDEWSQCAERAGLKGGTNLKISLETRAQSLTANAGGYTVQGNVVQGIESALKYFGGVQSVCRNLRTATGSPISYATCNDTSNVGAIVAENTGPSNTSVTFGSVSLGAFKYSSLVQPVSIELLQDSSIDIGAYIAEQLGTRLARIFNTHATSGAGTTLPFGVVVGSALGVTSASPTAITGPEIIDLFHSVDIAYRSQPGTCWMMNDATYSAIRKLTASGSGDFLWGAGLNGSGPDMLMGKPVVVNNDMDGLTASKKAILFGHFPSAYVWRMVSEIDIRVLNERYIDTGSVGFIAFARADGNTINSAAVKHLLTHA